VIPAVTKYRSGVTNSKLLLHFDDGNGSTAFTDVYGHTFTAAGGLTESTAQAKFGAGSLGATSSGKYISTPDASDLHFSGDLTWECFVYPTSYPSPVGGILGKQNASAAYNSAQILIDSSGGLYFSATTNTVGWSISLHWTGGALALNAWTHVAWVRNGSTFTGYVAGTSVVSGTLAGTLAEQTLALVVGSAYPDTLYPFLGYIDEVRISNVARYTANFTPPAAAFTF